MMMIMCVGELERGDHATFGKKKTKSCDTAINNWGIPWECLAVNYLRSAIVTE